MAHIINNTGEQIEDSNACMKFFDTNAILLTNLDIEPHFVISSITLTELEDIKVNRNKTEELRAKARHATRWLNKNEDRYTVTIYDARCEENIKSKNIEITNDTKIMACAELFNATQPIVFVTNDLCCKNIGRSIFKLNVESVERIENIYKGYRRIEGNTEYINTYMADLDQSDWNVNEYIIICNTDDGSEKEMRWDGERFVALKLPSSKVIKARNALQRCALDMLNNPDITVCAVIGSYGSGKTALTTKSALYQVTEKGNQAKINMVRNPIGEGKEIGYLSGDFEEKTEQFFLPLVQQLDGGEFELNSLKQRGIVEAHIPYYCKGLTFNESITVVDEAEDLNEKEIRLIGTRIGENSRIFFNGDYKQAIFNASEQNGLIRMCNELKGNPLFGVICLEEDVRSETSKLFASMFE